MFERNKRIVIPSVTLAVGCACAGVAQAGGESCYADLNLDGTVDSIDLAALLAAWGEATPSQADINGDGIVDGIDLGLMIPEFDGTPFPCTIDVPEVLPGSIEFVVVEVTDATTAAGGAKEFNVFAQMADAGDRVLNVLNANAACEAPPCFLNGMLALETASKSFNPFPYMLSVYSAFGTTFDTFVTMGVEYGPVGNSAVDPSFDVTAFEHGDGIANDGGWFSIEPTLGAAGEYPNLQVLLLRLAVPEDVAVTGELSLMYQAGKGDIYLTSPTEFVVNGPDGIVGDIDGDGDVDGLDLGILLANWSIPPTAPGCGGASPCAADINGDTYVDGLDLGLLLANWTI